MKKKMLTIGLVLAVCLCQAQSFKFAVMCDTRSNGNESGKSGVNVSAVKAVCAHLKNSGAEFVIAPGDFICGNVSWYGDNLPTNNTQYKAFLDAAESVGVSLPGGSEDITLYPVRGNHECYQQVEKSKEVITEAWLNNMGNSLPKNGPADEIGFTYSFVHKGSLFIGLDQYMHAYEKQKKGIMIDQQWLDKQLKENPDMQHVFAFGHTPAFAAKHEDCLGEDPKLRDAFMQSINDRSGVYFCGHDHFYARAEVPVYSPAGGIENYVQQVITPSGAPFLGDYGPKWDGIYPNKNVKAEKYIDNTLGYQLVTVDGEKVSVQYIATKDAASYTIDKTGKYHYIYNDNWETWKFITMDEFKYELAEGHKLVNNK